LSTYLLPPMPACCRRRLFDVAYLYLRGLNGIPSSLCSGWSGTAGHHFFILVLFIYLVRPSPPSSSICLTVTGLGRHLLLPSPRSRGTPPLTLPSFSTSLMISLQPPLLPSSLHPPCHDLSHAITPPPPSPPLPPAAAAIYASCFRCRLRHTPQPRRRYAAILPPARFAAAAAACHAAAMPLLLIYLFPMMLIGGKVISGR